MSKYSVEITIIPNPNWGKYECSNAIINECSSFTDRINSVFDSNQCYNIVGVASIPAAHSGTVTLLFKDNSEYFPGVIFERHSVLYDQEDGYLIGSYELRIECGNEADCMKCAHFMHYQLAGRQEYKDNKILLSVNDDKSEVLLVIDSDLEIRPLIIPISDEFILKANELV